MYKLLTAVLLIASITSTVFAESHTIRGTHWGMAMGQVEKMENWKYIGKKNGRLYYDGELKDGVACNLVYSFIDGKLMAMDYIMNGDRYLFKFFLEALKKKYDEPDWFGTEHGMTSHAKIYMYGFKGELGKKLQVDWNIHEGQTDLSITSLDNKKVHIFYRHKEYDGLKKQMERNEREDATYNLQDEL